MYPSTETDREEKRDISGHWSGHSEPKRETEVQIKRRTYTRSINHNSNTYIHFLKRHYKLTELNALVHIHAYYRCYTRTLRKTGIKRYDENAE